MYNFATLRQRLIWMANFLWRIKPTDSMEIVRQHLEKLAPANCTTVVARLNFFLNKVEILLRNMGVQPKFREDRRGTAGEQVGLDWFDYGSNLNANMINVRFFLIC